MTATTHVIIDMIDGHLIEHPAIQRDEDFLRLADAAQEMLCDLYQAIGRKHIAPEEDHGLRAS